MKCQMCNKNEAMVHFKQVLNGAVKELYVCKDCAVQHGFSAESPLALTDFLFGMSAQAEPAPAGRDKTCPVCHMRHSDFKKTARLGCASCYEAFSAELAPLLASMQGGGQQHVGKIPAKAGITAEIMSLQKSLKDAVASQNFEEAARLRDQLKGLKDERNADVQKAGRS